MNKLVANPKGKKLIKKVYPEKETDPLEMHQVEALMKYLLLNQGKLADIASYIASRVKKDCQKGRFGYVRVSMEVYKVIIKRSHSNTLTFYGSSVVSSIQFLLNLDKNTKISATKSQVEDMKILATETFVDFANARYNNNITEHQDLGFFVLNFIDMCNSNDTDIELKRKMRFYGFQGLHTFIATVDDLDGFVSKYVDTKQSGGTEDNLPINVNRKIVPTILDNMLQYRGDREGEPRPVKNLAISCLTDLSKSVVSAITSQSLVSALLKFLDQKDLWPQEDFCFECVKAISLKPQHNQVTITELLKHLGAVKERIRIHILNLLTSFFERIVRGPISPIIDFVLPLTKELIHSSSKKEDNETIAIVKSFALYGKRMSGSEKVEAISYLLEKLNSHFKQPRTAQVILQAILEILNQAQDLSKVFSTIHLEPLIDMSAQTDPMARILIGKVLVALIAANRRTSISTALQPDVWLTKAAGKIHKAIVQQAFLPDNIPENYVSIYDVLEALFSTNRGHELEYSIPLLFRLQQIAVEEKKAEPHLNRAVESVVAAYLLNVAQTYDNGDLRDYIVTRMNGEWTPALQYNNGKLEVRRDHFKKKHKKQDPITVTIDKQTVVANLSTISFLVQELGNRDLTQLFAMEMPVIQNPTVADPTAPSIPIILLTTSASQNTVEMVGAPVFQEIVYADANEIKITPKGPKKPTPVLPKQLGFDMTAQLSLAKSKEKRHNLALLESVFIQKVAHNSSSTLAINYPLVQHATLI